MPLKNTVARERRMDLASLFCLIGRHGPAVALAVVAMLSVLVGFIIYRTVRGKRRKAAADGRSPGAEDDAAVMQEPSPEERHRSPASTDVSDEDSSDVQKEDEDLIQRDLKVRQRHVAAAAAEKKPPSVSPLRTDVQVPDDKRTTPDYTEETECVPDSPKVAEMFTEEADQRLCDTSSVAGGEVEDVVDHHRDETDDKKDVEEPHFIYSNSKESEPVTEERHRDGEETVSGDENRNEEDAVTGVDVSDRKTEGEEEETLRWASSDPVCFEQTLHVSEHDINGLEDSKSPPECNLEEPVIPIEDVPVTYNKGEESEEDYQHPDSSDRSRYSSNDRLSPDEGKEDETEKAEEEESLDDNLIPQQAERSSTAADLPSSRLEQWDHVTDMLVSPIHDGDEDLYEGAAVLDLDEEPTEDHSLSCNKEADEVNSDYIDVCAEELNGSSVLLSPDLPQLRELIKVDDHITDAAAPSSGITDVPDLSLDGQQAQTDGPVALTVDEEADPVPVSAEDAEQKKDHRLIFDTDVDVLPAGADQVNGDDTDAFGEEQRSSSEPLLSEVDIQIDGVSVMTTDAAAQMSLDCQQAQKDVQVVPTVEEDGDPAHETQHLPESTENDAGVVLGDECDDRWCVTRDQRVQAIDNDAFVEAFAAARPDAVSNVTDSGLTDSSLLLSICQDRQGDDVDKNQTFGETLVHSDAAAGGDAFIAAAGWSDETSHVDVVSSSQEQKSDQTDDSEDSSDVSRGVPPLLSADINPPLSPIYLTSFEQSDLRDGQISSPGVGEESGISSMAVSPDLQDAANEFDTTVDDMEFTAMDFGPPPQSRLYADDAALSVIKGGSSDMVFGPFPSRVSLPAYSQHTDCAIPESLAANEDTLGHEIEDSYQRDVEKYAESFTDLTDEVKKQTDTEHVVEVVDINEKKEGVSSVKKEATEAEKEKVEDCEKTDISIMEATMDNNEWMTDSSCDRLPWMDLPAPSFPQDHTRNDQLPSEDCQPISSLRDAPCEDADASSSSQVKPASRENVEENTESIKKVVAVPPMPQNVHVTFRIHFITHSPYQTVAITGSQPELGNWKGFIPLEKAKDGYWAAVVSLPAESHMEWKFLVLDKGEVSRWEECGNRLLDTGSGDDLLVHKWWALL